MDLLFSLINSLMFDLSMALFSCMVFRVTTIILFVSLVVYYFVDDSSVF